MALLQVRNCPDSLYDALKSKAARERRSLAQQTVIELERALGEPEASRDRRRQLLADIDRSRPTPMPGADLNPADLVRQDRDR